MNKTTKIIVGVVVIIAIAAIAFALNQNKKLQDVKNSTQEVATTEVEKIISDVSKHIVLPANETPSAAVVSDLSKLKGQPFFERAELGDVVLVYANVRRVVLWRPSTQKIVEVSAINFPATTGQKKI